jgi:hypothetical protein
MIARLTRMLDVVATSMDGTFALLDERIAKRRLE